MDRQRIFEYVRNMILLVNPSLSPGDVTEFASMAYELGLDSLKIESLFSGLKEDVTDIDFIPWYIKTSRCGHDTVGSLVDYVDEHLAASCNRGDSSPPRPRAIFKREPA